MIVVGAVTSVKSSFRNGRALGGDWTSGMSRVVWLHAAPRE